MPAKRKTPPPPAPADLQPAEKRRLVHALGNSLSAARLRLDLLTRDTTCMWAQRANIEALVRTLSEASEQVNRLEELAWKE